MLQRNSYSIIMLVACVFLALAIPLFAGIDDKQRPEDVTLVIDGKSCGMLKTLTGGSVFANVISVKLGPDNIMKKHIAGLIYEELGMEMGFGLDPISMDW